MGKLLRCAPKLPMNFPLAIDPKNIWHLTSMSRLKSIFLKEASDFKLLRILIFLAGLLFLSFGLLSLSNDGLNKNYKFTIASIGWGVVILAYIIKKQLQLIKNKQIKR